MGHTKPSNLPCTFNILYILPASLIHSRCRAASVVKVAGSFRMAATNRESAMPDSYSAHGMGSASTTMPLPPPARPASRQPRWDRDATSTAQPSSAAAAARDTKPDAAALVRPGAKFLLQFPPCRDVLFAHVRFAHACLFPGCSWTFGPCGLALADTAAIQMSY